MGPKGEMINDDKLPNTEIPLFTNFSSSQVILQKQLKIAHVLSLQSYYVDNLLCDDYSS